MAGITLEMNSEELRFLELLPERLVGRLSRRGSL
jgi:hypothetical protein